MTRTKLLQHTLPPVDKTWSTGWVGAQMIDQSTSTEFSHHLVQTIDYRPTEKGLETPRIYPGIDVTTRY